MEVTGGRKNFRYVQSYCQEGMYFPLCGRKGKNYYIWTVLKKMSVKLRTRKKNCRKIQESSEKDYVGTGRIPVAGGFQEQVGRTSVTMWVEVGLDDFWRYFLAFYLCNPTALGIHQQHSQVLIAQFCNARPAVNGLSNTKNTLCHNDCHNSICITE